MLNCTRNGLVGVVAAVLLPWTGGPVQAGESANALSNGSFETLDDGGWPVGWQLSSQPTSEQAAGMHGFIDTEVRHHGNQSLRIEGRDVTARYAGLMHTAVELDGPATYRFSGWFKAQDYAITPDPQAGPAVHAFWFWVHVRGTEQRLRSASLAVNRNGTFDWRYVENEFKVPCPVTLHPGAWNGFNGTVWYDDIRIERIGAVQTTQTERGPDVKPLVDAFPNALRSRDDTFAVLFAPSVKKITRRIRAAEGALSAGPRAAISLARNEAEALQVVLAPLTDAPVTVEWYTSELRHRDSGRVLLDAVTVQPVGYMGYSDGEKLVTEPWPDILLADADAILQPNCLQPLWLEVRVPTAAPAGMYETTLTILSRGTPAAFLPVDIRVYDFALPSAPSLPTAMAAHTPAAQRVLLEHRVGLTYTCLPLVGSSRYDSMAPSIRLKAIRDGLEDHDYFVLLATRVKRASNRGRRDAVTEAAAKLTGVPPGIATSFTAFTSNAERVLEYRDLMARAIEALGETE